MIRLFQLFYVKTYPLNKNTTVAPTTIININIIIITTTTTNNNNNNNNNNNITWYIQYKKWVIYATISYY